MNTQVFLIILLISISYAHVSQKENKHSDSNNRPVVGVIAQPNNQEHFKDYSFIPSSYVQFIESSGARVIPIKYDLPEAQLTKIFNGINGLLIPGGSADMLDKNNSGVHTKFYNSTKFLFKLAMESNKNGSYFPIWGTCMGYQMILYFVSEDDDILEYFSDSINHSEELIFPNRNISRIFKDFTDEDIQHSEKHKVYFFNHHYGITPRNFEANRKLKDFFHISSISKSKNGTELVASIEAKEFPIYGVQFHPEKIQFIWTEKLNIPHSIEAINLQQKLGNFFNKETRRNLNNFSENNDLDSMLIYNYPPIK